MDKRNMQISGKEAGEGENAPNGDPRTSSEDKRVPEGDPSGVKGALMGAAAGAAGVFSAVPIIQTIGFGAGGIVADSIAAGMMSAAAVANGGGVAAGGTVATLQSIGAVGAIGAAPAVIAVAGCATIGFGISKLYSFTTNSSREAEEETAGETTEPIQQWYLGTIDEDENVIISSYLKEENARQAYDNEKGVKVLYLGQNEMARFHGNATKAYMKLEAIRASLQKSTKR